MSFPFTYLCMVPTSAGSDGSRLADRLSSVSVDMSHRAAGNSDRALFDRLRLRSLQNLRREREREQRVFQQNTHPQSLVPHLAWENYGPGAHTWPVELFNLLLSVFSESFQ